MLACIICRQCQRQGSSAVKSPANALVKTVFENIDNHCSRWNEGVYFRIVSQVLRRHRSRGRFQADPLRRAKGSIPNVARPDGAVATGGLHLTSGVHICKLMPELA